MEGPGGWVEARGAPCGPQLAHFDRSRLNDQGDPTPAGLSHNRSHYRLLFRRFPVQDSFDTATLDTVVANELYKQVLGNFVKAMLRRSKDPPETVQMLMKRLDISAEDRWGIAAFPPLSACLHVGLIVSGVAILPGIRSVSARRKIRSVSPPPPPATRVFAPQEPKPKPPAKAAEPKEDGASASSLPPFRPGDRVITISKKDKDKFDNKSGEVMWLKTNGSVRIRMLEGVAANTAKDFNPANLKRVLEKSGDEAVL